MAITEGSAYPLHRPRLLRLKQLAYGTVIRLLRRFLLLSVCKVATESGTLCFLDNLRQKRPTLLLIHGLATDKDSWLPLARHLSRRYRLLIPDLPGHGESVRDTSLCYDVSSQAQRLLELIETVAIDQVHLVGSSMGGAIACELAHLAPQRVASLTLIDSFGLEVTDSEVRTFIRQNGYNPLLYADNRADYRKKMHTNMARAPWLPGFALDVLAQRLVANRAINTKVFQDVDGNDQSANLPQITIPSLILWGEFDTVLHPNDAEGFRRLLPNSQMIMLPGVGHAAMVEVPAETARLVRDFIDAQPRADVHSP